MYGTITRRTQSLKAIGYYQAVCVILTLAQLLFGLVFIIVLRNPQEVIWDRSLIVVMSVLLYWYSKSDSFDRKFFFRSMNVLFVVVSIQSTYGILSSSFNLNYDFVFYFHLFLVSLSLYNLRVIAAYLLIICVVLVSALVRVYHGDRVTAVFLSTSHFASSIIIYFLALFRNRYNAQTRTREQLLRSLIETTENGMLVASMEGLVFDLNRRASEMFGYTHEELIDRDFRILRNRILQPEEIKRGMSDLENNLFWNSETELRRKDGSVFAAYISIGKIRSKSSEYLIYRVRDISEKKSYETALLFAKEEAVEQAQAKSLFLATMSHEIRTPLNGIIGMTSLLERTHLEAEQRTMVDTINRSSRNLLALVNDILDLAKMESGKMKPEYAPCKLKDSIQEACELLRPNAESKGLIMNLNIEDGILDEVITDAPRVQQVLLNLLGNAIKFTSEGQIDIFLKLASQWHEQLQFSLEVTDTGIGIAEEKIHLLFQSYSQISPGKSGPGGGSGLGLIISKELAELLGGSLTVSSKDGRGSSFVFTFRGQAVMDESNQDVAPETGKLKIHQSVLRQKRVLVTEDNPMNQQVLRFMLDSIGVHFTIVSTGEEAVTSYENEPFDLVLMDLNLPGIDGMETSRLISSHSLFTKIGTEIIGITANTMDSEKVLRQHTSISRVLYKPFTAHELESVVLLSIQRQIGWNERNQLPEEKRA